ncbi:MAG: hypothetical protein DRP82_03385 [Planctomycetota bacterium]|nr:MAG: hypothetical protein DRP82_03385 [Planctomycetota bacterium]
MRQVMYAASAVCAYMAGVSVVEERFGWLLLSVSLFCVAAIALERWRTEQGRFEALVSANALLALGALLWMLLVKAQAAVMLALLVLIGTTLAGLAVFLFFHSEKRWKIAAPGIAVFVLVVGLTVYLLVSG